MGQLLYGAGRLSRCRRRRRGSSWRGGEPGCRMRNRRMRPMDRLVYRRGSWRLDAVIQELGRRPVQQQDYAADDGQGRDAGADAREPASLGQNARPAKPAGLVPPALQGPVASSRPGGQRLRGGPWPDRRVAPRRFGPSVTRASRSQIAGPVGRPLAVARRARPGIALSRVLARAVAGAEHVGPDKPVRLRASATAGLAGAGQRLAATTSGAVTITSSHPSCWPLLSQCHSSSHRPCLPPVSHIPEHPVVALGRRRVRRLSAVKRSLVE